MPKWKDFYKTSILRGAEVIPMVAKVKVEDCVGCGLCEDACPSASIKVDEIAIVDANTCTNCGTCADECPNDAIEVEK